ncbi:MAG TPA: PxKF domain-containing protein [Nocardioides sp.]|nr:PxKF domain-containing protein [Nocardioides sp.]
MAGSLYARSGQALTLTVTTSNDAQCVDVAGAFTAHQSSATGKTSWTFGLTAGTGDGTRTVTISAAPNVNPQDKCTGNSNTTTASYVADNTGPVVTGSLSPAANGAGWNSSDVTVTWTATDTGSGVAGQPSPTVVSSNGTSNPSTSATDRVGNTGTGSVTVRLDRAAPTITGSASGTAGKNGWFISSPVTVTFTCADNPATGASGISSCLADGTSSSSRSIAASGSVGGTARDVAGNTSTTSVPVQIDTSGPVLAGASTTSPNANGWYRDDVTVHWTATDPQSGIPVAPSDTTITGEGTSLSSSQSAENGAGLTTSSTSAPTVRIDRTAPTTSVTGTPSNAWTDGSVNLALNASDNLSGVDQSFYNVDGGADTPGTSILLSSEGDHTITYWSVDKAGNHESPNTVHVRIDTSAPTIGHHFIPGGYHDNDWTNSPVTVTFTCDDQGGSGVASCTDPITKSAEGTHTVTGTATDGAGNASTDTAYLRIDLTKPTITATATGAQSEFGWYSDDVVVTYTCSDALSGIAGCSANDTLGEGANQAASGIATDLAGNTASDGVSGIDIDETDPVLTAQYSKDWHTGDVTVTWSCQDALSGIVGPDHSIIGPDRTWTTTVGGEGDALSATETCTDAAGNTATTTAHGIRIDRHPPVTTASAPTAPPSGWFTGAVEVSLDATDALSGVGETTYSIDGAAPKMYSGSFDVTGEGKHQVTFHSTDVAGNVEAAPTPLDVWIDTTAPATKVTNPISPATGWFVTSGIPFAFDATDADSGVGATYFTIDGGAVETYAADFTRDLSDGTHTVTYWSVDNAGNEEDHGSFAINVDTLPPSIEGHQSPPANSSGWNNSPVAVTFSCSDATSGVASGVAGCAGDTLLSNEGAGQSVPGDATDVAGNTTHTTYEPVNIDLTAPSLNGVPNDPNAAGWYHGDVTVKWHSSDALSGIDRTTRPADSIVTGEGRHLEATASVEDEAGNQTAASVTDLKIDRAGPTVSGHPTSEPNAEGWFNTSVVVDWTCTDPDLADGTSGSGVASCPESSLISGNGIGQSVTSGAPTDIAGNTGSTSAFEGVDIDGTAPVTSADNTCTKVNGWCTGTTAGVELTATDNLSGVKEIHYRIDGGAEQVAAGSSTTVSVPLSGSGSGTVSYWAVDVAGNVESPSQVALKWDNIAPTVTHTLNPAANAQGWNNGDVTVTFSAKDDDQGSGVASVSDPVTVSTETSGTNVTGTAHDTAGNVGTDTVKIKLDKTKPTISGAITSGTLGDNGWYVGPVTVSFTCTDDRSGVATCPDPVVLTSNGTNQSASGTAHDVAGNQASATVNDIKIDQEKPTITTVNVQGGSTYTLGSVPKPVCTATDSFSGPRTCSVQVTGGNANGVGTFAWTATARDGAGNTTTQSGTYKVAYQFDGFLQPINDTAHQVGTTTSIFKAGSTVPVKLVLKNAAGTVVQPASTPEWMSPVKGSSTSAPVDESMYSAPADSGAAFRSDGGQWIYNWKTPSSGGNYWRIGVKLDDGQTYYVNIGLR